MSGSGQAAGAMSLAFWYVTAFALSAALVPLCRKVAIRKGYVAQPRQDRWHSRPTALFGGVAIAVTTLILAVAAGELRAIALPFIGGALIFIVGLIDDVLSLKPSTSSVDSVQKIHKRSRALIREFEVCGGVPDSHERSWGSGSTGTAPQELTQVPCAAALDGVSEELASDSEGNPRRHPGDDQRLGNQFRRW